MKGSNPGNSEFDKEFVRRILQEDEKAWSSFVERYTDWVFYQANKWTKLESLRSKEKRRRLQSLKSEKEYTYSEPAIDVYIWIFQQLRKKLHAYTGKSMLSTYVWAVLHSKFLFIDFLRWRYSNPSYLPKAIQQCTKREQQVFILLRERKSVEQIALQLSLKAQEVKEIKESLIEKLFEAGQEYLLLRPVEIELSDELRKILALETNISGEERILLDSVVECFSKSLEKLSSEETRLLKMFYNEELNAKEILEMYKQINMNLPNKKVIQDSTSRDVFKAIERIKVRLLKLFQEECQHLGEAIIDCNTVKVFLDQLGAKFI